MRHFAAALDRFDSGWDIFTLLYHHDRLFSAAVADATVWSSERDALGFSTFADAGSIDGNDFMLLSYSFLTERDQRPFFDLWGVTYSSEASEQITAYGFEAVDKQMWVSNDVNGDPHPTPVAVDGSSEWPL